MENTLTVSPSLEFSSSEIYNLKTLNACHLAHTRTPSKIISCARRSALHTGVVVTFIVTAPEIAILRIEPFSADVAKQSTASVSASGEWSIHELHWVIFLAQQGTLRHIWATLLLLILFKGRYFGFELTYSIFQHLDYRE